MSTFPPPTPLRALDRLGLFFRVGRHDHLELRRHLAVSPPLFTGAVLDASLESWHVDLREDLARGGFLSVLDPMVLQLGTAGGLERAALRALPWGPADAAVAEVGTNASGIEAAVDAIAQFVVERRYTAVLAPTHYIEGVDDPRWRSDQAACSRLRNQLDRAGATDVPVYYRLAISRRDLARADGASIAERLADLDVDAVWLALHPVAANSGASVLVSYLDLCRALGRARVPLVGEHTGFLGLSLLGLNAVGGIESGITFGERFDMGNLLRKPRDGERKAFATQPRVYIDKLGTFLDRKDAERFLAERGAKRRFGCQDQPCCRSPEDMIKEPRRHFLYARAREVADLARVPAEARPTVLLDSIREASDGALQAARIDARFAKDQVRLGDWREALAKRVQAREHPAATIALGRGRFRRRKIA